MTSLLANESSPTQSMTLDVHVVQLLETEIEGIEIEFEGTVLRCKAQCLERVLDRREHFSR